VAACRVRVNQGPRGVLKRFLGTGERHGNPRKLGNNAKPANCYSAHGQKRGKWAILHGCKGGRQEGGGMRRGRGICNAQKKTRCRAATCGVLRNRREGNSNAPVGGGD